MPPDSDPFFHHPELRGKIADPARSFFRDFTTAKLERLSRDRGLPVGWWFPEDVREASRRSALDGQRDSDLWVFAYGSLMWDPAFRFAEVRRVHAPAHARRFILKDIYGARGTPEAPGLMAALDHGTGCDGLAFRIARDHIEEETRILWRREGLAPAYTPSFIDIEHAEGTLSALTFLADHGALLIDARMTRAEQIRCLATGTGFLGSSLQYLSNIAAQFKVLGIQDADVTSLLHDTLAFDGAD
jgi:cation transport protein ChaC